MRLLKSSFFIIYILFPVFCMSYPKHYDRMEIVKTLEREPRSLKIRKYIKIKYEDKPFVKTYWKVYYLKEKIVAEELFKDNRLVYYYTYYHTAKKIYQKGFFWHGIYRQIKIFKAHGKRIKQGWIYKNYPECYKVYNKEGKLTYSYYYKNFEI